MTRWAVAAFVACFLLGLGGGWVWVDVKRQEANRPEVRNQRLVNEALQNDLCERVKADLANFKESPTTFRRTSIAVIETESRASQRYLLLSQGVPASFPIEYRGESGGKYANCKKEVLAWINVPSVGSQTRGEEIGLAGIKAPAEEKSGKAMPVAAPRSGRVALVLGNSKYRNAPLPNAGNDAHEMAETLRELGFEVTEVRDASKPVMEAAVRQYTDALKSGEVGFLYYSGHGIELGGRNYLIPVDFNFNSEDEVSRVSIDLTVLLDKLSRAQGKVNIVVVDACRSRAVPSQTRTYRQGLAEMVASSGTLVGFSTSPGMVAEDGAGRNSPYTRALVDSLKKPGLDVEQVFKNTAKMVQVETAGRQMPWYSSNLSAPYSLN